MLSLEEQTALDQYYRENSGRMLHYAAAQLKSESKAEVAVQDTFKTAMERFSVFCNSPSPTGWLYKVLQFKIKEMQRERKRLLDRIVSLDSIENLPAEIPQTTNLNFEGNEDLRLLYRFHVEGYSIKELSEEAQTTVPAMKMRLSRARKRLRNDPNLIDLNKSDE